MAEYGKAPEYEPHRGLLEPESGPGQGSACDGEARLR